MDRKALYEKYLDKIKYFWRKYTKKKLKPTKENN